MADDAGEEFGCWRVVREVRNEDRRWDPEEETDMSPCPEVLLPPSPLQRDPHLLQAPHRRYREARERADHLLDVEWDGVVPVGVDSASAGTSVFELDPTTDDSVQEADADSGLPAFAGSGERGRRGWRGREEGGETGGEEGGGSCLLVGGCGRGDRNPEKHTFR